MIFAVYDNGAWLSAKFNEFARTIKVLCRFIALGVCQNQLPEPKRAGLHKNGLDQITADALTSGLLPDSHSEQQTLVSSLYFLLCT